MPRSLGLHTLRVLAAVRDGARYGLDIVERTGLPSGTVYPVLARLRRRGLLRSHWEADHIAELEGRPRRKYHEVTEAGRSILDERRAELRRARGLTPAPKAQGSP